MKLQLFVDPVSNKIFGYNKAFTENDLMDRDNIFIDVDKADRLFKDGSMDNLYYIDGEVQEAITGNGYDAALKQLQEERDMLAGLVKEEGRLFMDNLIKGLALDECREIAKGNRDRLDEAERRLLEIVRTHSMEIEQYYRRKRQKEEMAIEYRHYVSALLLVRDENDYLEEWLGHFLGTVGVDHVYLYDNESSVSVKEYLESISSPYLDRITFVGWKTTGNTQEDACNHFLRNYGDETRWVIPVDADEFVRMNAGSAGLKEFLRESEEYASVLCQWVHYNAGGQEKKSSRAVMERFISEAGWYGWEHSGKRFIQTNRCAGFRRYNPILRAGCRELDNADSNKDVFQLNHYITKSFEEWKRKMARGSCDPNALRNCKLFFVLNPDMAYLDTGEDFVQGYGPAAGEEEAEKPEDGRDENKAGQEEPDGETSPAF